VLFLLIAGPWLRRIFRSLGLGPHTEYVASLPFMLNLRLDRLSIVFFELVESASHQGLSLVEHRASSEVRNGGPLCFLDY